MADFDLEGTKSPRSKANSRIPNEREEEGEIGGRERPTFLLFPPERVNFHATIRRKNDPLSRVLFAQPCTIVEALLNYLNEGTIW